MANILIFGTGDIAQIAKYYFEIDSEHEVVGFTVDKEYMSEDQFEGLPIIAFEEVQKKFPPSEFKLFIALSYSKMNSVRESKYRLAKKMGYELVSYVSSRCSYMSQFKHGDNCFIFEDNTIQPFTRIGNNVTLWSGNHIGHHSTIGDHNFISSHVVISGHCTIGNNCFLGVNSTIHNNIEVASGTLLAAGAIINKDTQKDSVHLPARSTILGKKSFELNI